jgi:hypothetical protein
MATVRMLVDRPTAMVSPTFAPTWKFAVPKVPSSQTLLHFLIECGAIGARIGRVGRLHRQLTDALQVVGHFLQSAFRGLRQRHAVVGIAGGLVEAVDLGGHARGDGQAGRVVLGAVDAQAR